MALSRIYEEQEVGPALRRIFADVRQRLDLPFVPTIFKLTAGSPDYLKTMWADLGPVASCCEFQTAAKATEEYAWSLVSGGGWRFSDQEKELRALKFSSTDIEFLCQVASIFQRALARMVLFSRLMQRGYCGGQKGKVSAGQQASALSRMMLLRVPGEREAGLRVHLLYNDIRRTTGLTAVMSLFRALSPYPGYLASVWMDSKRLLREPAFQCARDDLSRRTLALIAGLPAKDHRAALREFTPAQWREIEELVDGFARQFPQFLLLAATWQRSFPVAERLVTVA